MNAKRRPDRVIDTFMAMDHYERDRAFRHAMADGDRKRGLEHHRAIWLSRRKQLDIELTITRQPAINAHAHGYPGTANPIAPYPRSLNPQGHDRRTLSNISTEPET